MVCFLVDESVSNGRLLSLMGALISSRSGDSRLIGPSTEDSNYVVGHQII